MGGKLINYLCCADSLTVIRLCFAGIETYWLFVISKVLTMSLYTIA